MVFDCCSMLIRYVKRITLSAESFGKPWLCVSRFGNGYGYIRECLSTRGINSYFLPDAIGQRRNDFIPLQQGILYNQLPARRRVSDRQQAFDHGISFGSQCRFGAHSEPLFLKLLSELREATPANKANRASS